MSYFKQFPNIQYVNRFPNTKSNDEVTVAKNLFKRGKIREDLISVFAVFDYYTIGDEERPDQISAKLYGNPEYDWVILISNNIIDLYNEWPLSQAQFNEYLMKKYGSEEALEQIHHYETIELKDSYGRIVLPGGLIVDQEFYNSPRYETINEVPPGITFPPIYLDGIVAITTARLGSDVDTLRKVVSVDIGNSRGYKTTPTVTFSPPTTTLDASASTEITDFRLSSIVGINTGKGYRQPPTITIDPPPDSIQATAESVLGVDIQSNNVVSVNITNSGIGYGLTAPSIQFSLPPIIVSGGIYKEESPISIGTGVDGMYVKSDGSRVFSTGGVGIYLVKSFNLTTPWSAKTTTFLNQLNVSSKFSFCTGIEFSPDGTRMFLSGGKSGNFLIGKYNLLLPWEIITASFESQILVTAPGGVRLNPDGTRLYILNSNNPDSIEEYQLSVAWDITTRSFINSYNISTPTGDNGILGFSFNANGTKMFACGIDNTSIYEFDLDSWDLSTLTYVTNLYVGDRISNPSDVFVSSDIDYMLISGGTNDKLTQYNNFSRAKGVASVENGSVSRIDITTTGIGYTVPPIITIDPPYQAIGAAATAILSDSGGYISDIIITNSGFGYTTAPSITIEKAPYYSTAVGIASVINEKVVSISVIDGGNNYDTAPTITLTPDPGLTLNVFEGDIYSQADTTWRWNGTAWQEQITEPYQFLDGSEIKSSVGSLISRPVSVYEYEQKINEDKRLIIVPKQQYINTIIRDMNDIMKYDVESDDSINSRLKTTYNPKLTGV